MKGLYRLRKFRDAAIRAARRVRRILVRRAAEQPGPKSVLDRVLSREAAVWRRARDGAQGARILIATSTGGHRAVTPIESLLGVALTLRGATVHYLLCDGILPGCLQAAFHDFSDPMEFAENGPAKTLCGSCIASGNEAYKPLGLPIHRYSEWITDAELSEADRTALRVRSEDIPSYRFDGLVIGEHALAGALRYFARGTLDGEPSADRVLRRYFKASLLTLFVMRRLMARFGYDAAVFHHGIYVPQGIVGEAARAAGARVVNWCPAYRKRCFLFSERDSYHRTLIDEPTENWENMPWTAEMESQILAYLKSRWTGSEDWIWFHERPDFDPALIAGETGIDLSKPCIGMLTNVMWDAQLHFGANAFPNMLDWAAKTIRHFEKRADLQLLIRVHPAEIRGTTPSRQPLVAELRRIFPVLPKNVFLIGPESPISTYVAMMTCDSVLIYGTKMGMELTAMGVPVIVAGEAWVRNKGFTLDAVSEAHYYELLDRLPLGARLSEAALERARKYAYHFFFRRMIPVGCLEPRKGWPPFKLVVDRLEDLAPGADPGLDVICDGILNGRDFTFSPDAAEPADAEQAAPA